MTPKTYRRQQQRYQEILAEYQRSQAKEEECRRAAITQLSEVLEELRRQSRERRKKSVKR